MGDHQRLKEIQDRLRGLVPILRDRYEVESLALFGSFVRREDRTGSDLDVLITFRQPPNLFEFIELENYLSEALGVKVDLVLKDVLKPRIRQRVLDEAVPI